jgi:hypothetical protein
MDLEELVANVGVELACNNLLICELKHVVKEEKKNSNIIRKENLTLQTDLAICVQIIHELQMKGEEKIESCGQFS